MLSLHFPTNSGPHVLCLGAHCDDIEIGCGGAMLRFAQSYPDLTVQWLVFSSNDTRKAEALESASLFLQDVRERHIDVMTFRDGFFPYVGSEIKEVFERKKAEFQPDIIFTHYRHDRHQDHRLISDLTWNTFRNHLILEYEILKYDGDIGSPNFFIPIEESFAQRKIRDILGSFQSQASKPWFTEDALLSMLRIRGVESNALSRYAEGFYSRKLSI